MAQRSGSMPSSYLVDAFNRISYVPDTNLTSQFDHLTEHRGPIELSIKGTIPAWAAGSLFRHGPGSRRIENVKTSAKGQQNDNKGSSGTVLIQHWFDGLAHLHRFDIVPATGDSSTSQPVRVLYSSRRQGDEFVKYVQDKGSFGDTVSFGQRSDPCVGMFSKVMSCFRALDQGSKARLYDNLNVAVLPAPKLNKGASNNSNNKDSNSNSSKVWLTSDIASLRTLDTTTLSPQGPLTLQSDLHPSLKGALSSAHAQICPRTGDLFNYNLQPGPVASYRIFRVSAATGETDVLATVARPDLPPAYIHSFFLSERFVVLRVAVAGARFAAMGLSVPWRGNLVDGLAPWDGSKACRWFVVDRVHGRGVVAEFETPAVFFFHSVNCWDEDVAAQEGVARDGAASFADIFCEVIDHPSADIVHKHYYDVLMNKHGAAKKWYTDEAKKKNSSDSNLVRWKFRVPLPTSKNSSMKASPKQKPEKVFAIPSPHTGELPTINPHFQTRPHRYVYSLPQTGRSTFVDTIVKTDTATREVLQWDNPVGHTPGEAIFVPRPGGEAEDDGVLLSVVLDGGAEKSYLLCLDARTMEELGRAEMEFVVGFGLHGMHSAE